MKNKEEIYQALVEGKVLTHSGDERTVELKGGYLVDGEGYIVHEGFYGAIFWSIKEEKKLLWRRPVKLPSGSWVTSVNWCSSKKEFMGAWGESKLGPWESMEEPEVCDD